MHIGDGWHSEASRYCDRHPIHSGIPHADGGGDVVAEGISGGAGGDIVRRDLSCGGGDGGTSRRAQSQRLNLCQCQRLVVNAHIVHVAREMIDCWRHQQIVRGPGIGTERDRLEIADAARGYAKPACIPVCHRCCAIDIKCHACWAPAERNMDPGTGSDWRAVDEIGARRGLQSDLYVAGGQNQDCQVPTGILVGRVLRKQTLLCADSIGVRPERHCAFVHQVVRGVRYLDEVVHAIKIHSIARVRTGCCLIQQNPVPISSVIAGDHISGNDAGDFIQRPLSGGCAFGY